VNNALQYVAELDGFRFNAMVAAGEGSVADARFWGFSAGYSAGGFDVGIGHQQRKRGFDYKDALQNTMVGASYSAGPWKVYGSWTRAKDAHPALGAELRAGLTASTNPAVVALRSTLLQFADQIAGSLGYDGRLLYGGVHYQLGERNRVVLSYGDYNDREDRRDVAIAGLAFEHQLSKRTSIWLSRSYTDNKSFNQVLPYSQGLLYGFTDRPGRDASASSLNVVHRF
jgi:predicted porin